MRASCWSSRRQVLSSRADASSSTRRATGDRTELMAMLIDELHQARMRLDKKKQHEQVSRLKSCKKGGADNAAGTAKGNGNVRDFIWCTPTRRQASHRGPGTHSPAIGPIFQVPQWPFAGLESGDEVDAIRSIHTAYKPSRRQSSQAWTS